MKYYKFVFLFNILLAAASAAGQYRVISGRVTAHSIPLEFATVTIAGKNIGAMTDGNGMYRIERAPVDSCSVVVTLLGYATQRLTVATRGNAVVNAALEKEARELNEVVVSGVSGATLKRENPLPVETVSQQQMDGASENNAIDAIAKNATGLQAVKTGPNVSKPFINGLGYNRVLTLYDGMRVETQQWGDEHGVPMDDYVIAKAEVIEGPASLMYGSDAIAGVLSIFPQYPKDTDRVIHGRYLSEYQTNNGLVGNFLMLSWGSKHFSWSVRGSERIAKNYEDPVDGRVYNTGFRMANGSAYMGYETEKGFTGLNLTVYDNRQGIPDGSRDSATRQFTYQEYESAGENVLLAQVDNIKARPLVQDDVLNSYALSPLAQRIQDYRLYLNNDYRVGAGQIIASAGVEQNIRREYDHPTDPTLAGEYIVLNTLDYSARYLMKPIAGIEPTIGINGMYQENVNRGATDFPIPGYHLLDIGGFACMKWKHKNLVIAGGIRYDHRSEQGAGMYIKPNASTGFYEQMPAGDTTGGTRQFPAFGLKFQGVSGSMGATYRLSDHVTLKGNIGRGYRAPNITEIASNGLDPGAHIVYEGNSSFKPEFSLQEDVGVTGSYRDLTLGADAFVNNIQNYIYEDQKVDAQGNPVVVVPGNKTFQFQQTEAELYGLNANVNLHPERLNRLTVNNALSCVFGYNLNPRYKGAGNQGEYLPFIPPPRWLCVAQIELVKHRFGFESVAFKAENDLNLAQNRYLGLYQTETATPAYDLVNMGLHGVFATNKVRKIQAQVQVNNVLNTAYQSHLSRLQYFEYYTQSPTGRYGIYNMGRNVCFKVIVPF